MFEPNQDQSPTAKWAILAALSLHAALLGLALTLAVPQALAPPETRPLNVDTISSAQFEALTAPDAPEISTSLVDQPAQQTAPSAEEDFVSAETFLASAILADPENEEVRRTLPRLATSEQIIQLCNIEGLEQLRLGGIDPAPDTLVGYAYDEIDLNGFALTADGGAYRTGGHWFHIRYRCAVSTGIAAVSNFEYSLGGSIPETEWRAHYLNADDDWLN